jgi:hypothetical protein
VSIIITGIDTIYGAICNKQKTEGFFKLLAKENSAFLLDYYGTFEKKY